MLAHTSLGWAAVGIKRHTQAGQGVDTINVHGAATADTLTAGAAEGQGGVLLVLYPDESIEHHRTGLVEVEVVGLHSGLLTRGIRVPTVDLEGLHLGWGLRGIGGLTGLDSRIGASEGSGPEERSRRSEEPRRRAEGGHGGRMGERSFGCESRRDETRQYTGGLERHQES